MGKEYNGTHATVPGLETLFSTQSICHLLVKGWRHHLTLDESTSNEQMKQPQKSQSAGVRRSQGYRQNLRKEKSESYLILVYQNIRACVYCEPTLKHEFDMLPFFERSNIEAVVSLESQLPFSIGSFSASEIPLVFRDPFAFALKGTS